MWELARKLPLPLRPRSVLYPASGIHVAPLVLCEALPTGEPFLLELTELDPSTAGPIGDLLADFEGADVISDLKPLDAAHGWQFRLAGHPVTLRIRLLPAGTTALLSPELLAGHDMVVSHDWAGDPVGNLRVILEFLDAARESLPAPLLMIEDLEAHPYPISLDLFETLARTSLPYGHRAGPVALEGHPRLELGPPLFRGAVILGFPDPWWLQLDRRTLGRALDLLIFDRFGWSRRNVLAPGPPPVVPPAVLDHWTGFGARTVEGPPEYPEPAFIGEMVEAGVRAATAATGPARRAFCDHLTSLRHVLALLAADRTPPPPDTGFHELTPADLPPPLASPYAEAMRYRGRADSRASRLREAARQALVLFDEEDGRSLLGPCAGEAGSQTPVQQRKKIQHHP